MQLFLTPLREQGSGNLVLLPGSHLRPLPPRGSLPTQAAGQVVVLAKPGDIVVWDGSLLHRVEPNGGAQERLSVILAYGFSWLQPSDYGAPSEEFEREASAVQRLLTTPQDDRLRGLAYYPSPEDASRHLDTLERHLGELGPLPFSDMTSYTEPS